jgi:hypothetical protein
MGGCVEKSSKAGYVHGRKVCIFCGSTPTTREHIWADWARGLLPESSGYQQWVFKGRRGSKVLSREKMYNRQGAVRTLTVKRLCEPCNSLWRGKEEERLKPLLTDLFNGAQIALTQRNQEELTEYLTAKILTIDWLDGDPITNLGTSADFYESRLAPPGFTLHIFNCYEGRWRAQFRAFACELKVDESGDSKVGPPNTKAFAVGFGNLFVFAIIAMGEFHPEPDFDAAHAIQLWPNPKRAALWPPRIPLTSEGADTVALTLDRFFASLSG